MYWSQIKYNDLSITSNPTGASPDTPDPVKFDVKMSAYLGGQNSKYVQYNKYKLMFL